MATQNQLVVAEALRIARTQGRRTGFTYLVKRLPTANEEWFMAKCEEHGIR